MTGTGGAEGSGGNGESEVVITESELIEDACPCPCSGISGFTSDLTPLSLLETAGNRTLISSLNIGSIRHEN